MISIDSSWRVEPVLHPVQELRSGVRHVATQIHEGVCALRGHELVLQVGPHRMYLKCLNCGHETHGWTMADPPQPVRRRPVS